MSFPSRSFLLALLLGLLITPLVALAAPLDARVAEITSRGGAGRALWGVHAIDLRTGRVLAELNHDRLMIPASNRKLVSTAMAAAQFEPGFRFSTELRGGPLDGGVLRGDLSLAAAGDPSWTVELTRQTGSARLRELARGAREAGLREVTGDLVIHLGRFSEPDFLGMGWTWDNLAQNYSSRPGALSINRNLGAVAIRPTRQGEAVAWSFPQGGDPFDVRNEAVTTARGATPTLSLDLELGGRTLVLRGGLPADSPETSRAVPVSDPTGWAGRLMLEALRNEGITVGGGLRIVSGAAPNSPVLARVEGAEMAAIVGLCNRDSDNFLAEMLYLHAGARRQGVANYRAAREAERRFWEGLGVQAGEWQGADGSGLSRQNYITPRALTTLLQKNADLAWWVDSLPVSGRTGTLRYRLSADGMAGRVMAKTGTLDGVSGLSGYVRTNGGGLVAFSIIANNYTTSSSTIRRAIDEIVVELARR